MDSMSNVYVADSNNYRIQKFASNGNFIGWWGRDDLGGTGWHGPLSGRTGVTGSGDGEFNSCRGIAIDSMTNVYVTDSSNHRVQVFTSTGVFLRKWGSYGGIADPDGRLNMPQGVALDSAGNVYVVDGYNRRVQKFTSNGGFIRKWTGSGSWSYPTGIAVDPTGTGSVYVVGNLHDDIQKFDTDGTFKKRWKAWGIGNEQFYYPYKVAVAIP